MQLNDENGTLRVSCSAALSTMDGRSFKVLARPAGHSTHLPPQRPRDLQRSPELNVQRLCPYLRYLPGSAGRAPSSAAEDPAAQAVQELVKYHTLRCWCAGRAAARYVGAAGAADRLRGGQSNKPVPAAGARRFVPHRNRPP
jgi:hypothetical protein